MELSQSAHSHWRLTLHPPTSLQSCDTRERTHNCSNNYGNSLAFNRFSPLLNLSTINPADFRKRGRNRLLEAAGMEWRTPMLLNLGVALAVPLAGYIVSLLNFPAVAATADDDLETRRKRRSVGPCGCSKGIKDGLAVLLNDEATTNIIHGASTTPTATTTDNSTAHSPKSNNASAQEVKRQFNSTSIKSEGNEVKVEEIYRLRDLVQCLCDRNRSLETYYGLKEQEVSLRELENQLTSNSIEVQCLIQKIESLEDENQMLRIQASERQQEFQSAKVEVKQLKRRLKSVNFDASQKIASLELRIRVLNDLERKERQENEDLQSELKELGDEAAQVRKESLALEQEKLDLAHRLESAQNSVTDLEDSQAKLLKEVHRLREANDNLQKNNGQLYADRCAEGNELVYLKWMNSCLRYELRERHQTPRGKAKSPMKLNGTESSRCAADDAKSPTSNSQESNGDCSEDDSFTVKKTGASKPKLLGKLKKMVLRKGSSKKSKLVAPPVCDGSEIRASPSCSSLEGEIGGDSFDDDSIISCFAEEHAGESHKIEDPAWFRAAFRSQLNVIGTKLEN